MDNTQEISLLIEGQVFKAKKNVLCENSDYFRAMFSGNYVEQERREIAIDVVDSNSMTFIMRYMDLGLIDLSELPLSTVGDLARAANFLQMTELMKQIEYCLDQQLSLSTWIDTMSIAENSSYSKLEQYCAAYGLFSFKRMNVECIPSIHKLFWYLSHPYLDTESELQAFKFGLKWILHAETGADALLILLGCLDYNRLIKEEIAEMNKLTKDYKNSLAEKVIKCLLKVSTEYGLTEISITDHKKAICEEFTERVYTEVLSLVKQSIRRKLEYTPVVPMWVLEGTRPILAPHFMYSFTKDKGYQQWLEVAEKDLWGWNVTAWDLTKLVVVGGEHGRGTGIFMRDVKVYDTLRKEWTQHGVQLPPRRHSNVTILRDTLFLVGGVGAFRVILDTTVAYDLKQRSYRNVAKIPDAIQNPAVCTHNNKIYTAGHKNIYVYQDRGNTDKWKAVLKTDLRPNCMVPHKEHIYCTQNFFSSLHRFRPGIDKKLEIITSFRHPPSTFCTVGDRIIGFTGAVMLQAELLTVEEWAPESGEAPEPVWKNGDCRLRVNDVAGTGVVVMTVPPVNIAISTYHKRNLSRYE